MLRTRVFCEIESLYFFGVQWCPIFGRAELRERNAAVPLGAIFASGNADAFRLATNPKNMSDNCRKDSDRFSIVRYSAKDMGRVGFEPTKA